MRCMNKVLILLASGAMLLGWGMGCNLLPAQLEAAILEQTDFWWERKQGEVEDWFNIGADGQIATEFVFDLIIDSVRNHVDEAVPDAAGFPN